LCFQTADSDEFPAVYRYFVVDFFPDGLDRSFPDVVKPLWVYSRHPVVDTVSIHSSLAADNIHHIDSNYCHMNFGSEVRVSVSKDEDHKYLDKVATPLR
jgi:hypothetical protein